MDGTTDKKYSNGYEMSILSGGSVDLLHSSGYSSLLMSSSISRYNQLMFDSADLEMRKIGLRAGSISSYSPLDVASLMQDNFLRASNV
ncbi:MAG: hypothetical protein QG635_1632, partial [Bacteroidota bacterium]|nr:hypothetical protein [Bacteroidota bacterium]